MAGSRREVEKIEFLLRRRNRVEPHGIREGDELVAKEADRGTLLLQDLVQAAAEKLPVHLLEACPVVHEQELEKVVETVIRQGEEAIPEGGARRVVVRRGQIVDRLLEEGEAGAAQGGGPDRPRMVGGRNDPEQEVPEGVSQGGGHRFQDNRKYQEVKKTGTVLNFTF